VLKFGFPRKLRLTDNNDIRQVCRKGRKISSPLAAVFFYPNQLGHSRLCVSVAKKQISKAWRRNTIKRIARESFRFQQHQLPHQDIVIVVFKPLAALDKKQLREVINAQWQKLIPYSKSA